MALSLREKLQRASLASLATNAAKTRAKLDTMEQAPTADDQADRPEPTSEQASQEARQQAKQRPGRQPSTRGDEPVPQAPGEAAHQAAAQVAAKPHGEAASDQASTPQSEPKNDPEAAPRITPDFRETLTPIQQRVLAYLAQHQGEIVRYADIAQACAVPPATAQTVCRRFKALAVLSSRYASRGRIKGLRFSLDDTIFARPEDRTAPGDVPAGEQATEQARQQTLQGNNLGNIRKDFTRLSKTTMQTVWPTLARAGFGLEQFESVTRMLVEQGKPTDRLVQGLDHLEYELANDRLRDKDGRPVPDPCAWALRILAQNGYSRRPADYVSPEEQALRDQEAEARALTQASLAAEQARFEAWEAGLDEEERRRALHGHRTGSPEAWLKKVWKDRLRD